MTDTRSVSYKSGSSILNSLKFINVNSRKAIQYTVAVVQFTGNKRVDKGYGRLMRQILSDPTYVVEIIKRRTADIIDMANHVKIRVKTMIPSFSLLLKDLFEIHQQQGVRLLLSQVAVLFQE